MPARISFSIMRGDRVSGPMVQTILEWRTVIVANYLLLYQSDG
jgi:hypothetical protein